MLLEVIGVLIRIIVACMIPYMPAPCKNKNEYRCRAILQVLTGEEFSSTRSLPWLTNPLTGRRLELDGYSDTLKIGLEVNGNQHYRKGAYYSTDLEYQVYKDKVKEKLCLLNGVTLIIVPYTIPRGKLCSYILSKLELISSLQEDYIP